ncbi:FAD-dependent oxidoreductase [Parapusillimonas granuli]|uniref:FAD-dependent oxidoreductase n=1 Tax=Parapusillimonas granuli TaxID=380911 RepID=A0A853FVF4_9BURK|nr:FAD-dependent oxidoreductase [Parapusillimonas granuli]MBB5215349.1 succinate dehydrogenase/fumarate reductase flavoprotein subunit [Parapusillimonas granuli]MEB2400189.1 FAD-dependent oxidoreductase [Alcaligenaceae bacterium]NYT49984.1 FAD-dependent oxidoreductase [Parapusillimonas granuli]
MQENNEGYKEVDLLVLGGGAAGMTTALVAALEGLDVLLAEKTDQVGGTMSTSAGTIWIPGNQQSREAGYQDTVDAARVYLDALIGTPDDTGIREVYLRTAPEMVEYLRRRSDVQFAPCGKHPDYRDMAGAAVAGRGLAPVTFDGRLLGKDFERVRPPIPEFMVLGGMMAGKSDIPRLINRFRSVSDFLYSGGLFLRYLKDRLRYSRGTRVVMGNALAARLYYSLKKNGVPVLFETQAESLFREDGRVAGALLRSAGRSLRVRARRGVVIATGGYGHDAELRRRCMPAPTPPYSLACAANTGDGIRLGLQSDGAIRPETQGPGAFWTPVSVLRRPDGSKGLFPHLSLDRAKPGLIAVNGAGRRFVNEADSYHDFVEGIYASHKSVPTMPAYLVCEADFVRRYGLGAVYPGTTDLSRAERSGYLVVAPTLQELARRIQVPEPAFAETVRRYNEMARLGTDLEFGKGGSELNRFNGDPEQKPNPCLRPIEHGPFVALAVWPAEIGTSTGLVSDADGQVLDGQGRPVGGLYVAGNDMASIMMGTYPGPGTTLGPALTFGYRVARHAAGVSAATRKQSSTVSMA